MTSSHDALHEPAAAPSLRSVLRRMWTYIGARRRRQIAAVGALMVVSGFFELVTLGAVVPFLAILTAPERVFAHPIAAPLISFLGTTSPDRLVLPLAVLFTSAALMAAAARLLLLWANDRMAYAISGDFATEIFRRTLYQPYSVHARRNSSVILSSMTQKTDYAIKMLVAQLTVATAGVQMLALTSVLMTVNPLVTAVAGMALGSTYGVLSWLSRRRLRHNSRIMAREQTGIITIIQEGLGAIRDVLLEGAQPMYAERYRRAQFALRRASSVTNFIVNAPRFVVEALGIALVVVLAYWMSRAEGGFGAALPVLGVMALGAQRLLPLVQMSFGAWSTMMGCVAIVSEMLDLLDQPLPADLGNPPAPLGMRRGVEFNAARFRYRPDGPWVLNGLTLSIPKGVRMGVIGETGSGKSTFSDLMMGLLEPTEGTIAVDGVPLTPARLGGWQRSIAHVPQSIYLADTSIAENIAFGVRPRDIDMDRVRHAAAQAHIAQFVDTLPQGYLTAVGERGVRLSGGQRQRIGIARALYRRPALLVLDEATSALDNATEQAVMETIEQLDRDLTIVVVAHRLTTLRRCDRLVELTDGRAVEYRSFEHMMQASPCALKEVTVASVRV